MTDPFRLLGANLRVAANMRYSDDQEKARAAAAAAWSALQARAATVGAILQTCYLDPDCDGECGCGFGLRDKDGNWIKAEVSSVEDLAMVIRLIEQLESGVGLGQ